VTLAPLETISLHGARVHNLKNISVDLPRDKLIVVTGLSGSGKSSLAFDTVYAEGQRRYIESMSLHARQYVEQMEKPDVDLIEGLSPAIAIEQKTSSRSSKSTVGTVTEIYDYLRLLYSRIGVPKCPDHNVPIKGQTPEQILEHIMSSAPDAKIYLYGVYAHGDKGTFEKDFEALRKKGFSRARIDGKEVQLQDVSRLEKNVQHDIEVAVDRLKNNGANKKRLLEALEAAAGLGKGSIFVRIEEGTKVTEKVFSTKAACPICFFSFPPLSPRLFSFNSPYGMCATCDGAGVEVEFSPELLLPDVDESLWDFFGELTDIFPAAVDREAKRIFKKTQHPAQSGRERLPEGLTR
jgi:excinuclease ABC subunit A